MGGGDTKTVQQQQSSQTDPYAPTQPLLQNIINSLSGQSTGVTGGQSTALTNLNNAASSLPDFSSGATTAVNNALGTNTTAQQGMLGSSYQDYIKNLQSTANGDNLDPYKTPGFSDAIATMTNDITNNVKGVYAGSGRDPSGAGSFAGSLGQGLTRGIAPVIQQQANTNYSNMKAANDSLLAGAGSTASGITQQQLAALQGQFQGLAGAAGLPGLLTGNANTQLSAANAAYNQPYANIGAQQSLAAQLAALGGQSTGNSTSTTEQSKSLLSNILGGVTGGLGALGQTGAFASAGGSGWLSSMLPFLAASDERVKENIEPVGELNDGQTVYSYNYIGDVQPTIGLLAQEVEKVRPDAVVEFGGVKHVHYGKATERARGVGMLKMAA